MDNLFCTLSKETLELKGTILNQGLELLYQSDPDGHAVQQCFFSGRKRILIFGRCFATAPHYTPSAVAELSTLDLHCKKTKSCPIVFR